MAARAVGGTLRTEDPRRSRFSTAAGGRTARCCRRLTVLKRSVLAILPFFATTALILGYAFTVGFLSELFPGSAAKVPLFAAAMLVKVGGNKALVRALTFDSKASEWFHDFTLFMYELFTATLSRMVQLSISDTATLALVSLVSCVLEAAVRSGFTIGTLVTAVRTVWHHQSDEDDRGPAAGRFSALKHAARCSLARLELERRARVADNHNVSVHVNE